VRLGGDTFTGILCGGEAALANRIWIDIEDLFKYAKLGLRPSGIQRLEYELCRALHALPEARDRIFFLRHDPLYPRFVATTWEAIEADYCSMVSERFPGGRKHSSSAAARILSAFSAAIRTLMPELHKRVSPRVEAMIRASRLLRAKIIDIVHALKRYRRFRHPGATSSFQETDYFDAVAGQGDVLAFLGAPWSVSDVTSGVERARREKGLRFVLLIYDIIALRHPEWCEQWTVETFRTWFERTLPQADAILAISAATARDLTEYARITGLTLRAVPAPIPIGTGFGRGAEPRSSGEASSVRLPAPGNYALIVSTIEARKNHVLLFRVWRRLLEDMPMESVPALVFAGRIGWQVSDLMQQLRNSKFLNGKIIHIDSPTDQELEALYSGCLFTLFPSFYEGWGLPVTESLAFGRPCIISNTTSLPEAGGSLARYIDPDNTSDAYRVIRETIENQAELHQWRDHVRQKFQPVEWTQSAQAVLRAVDKQDASRFSEQALRHRA
jgi:glycosyltransferase involved in cell wall biosynthesis